MTQQALSQNLQSLTESLLGLASQYCWNKINPNVRYVIKKVDVAQTEGMDTFQTRKWRNQMLKNSPILSLDQAMEVLYKGINNIYLIELYVFHAKKKETLIEIEVLEKSELEEAYQETLTNHIPTFHCKVTKPPYVPFDFSEQFDINWQLETLEYHWKMFWWNRKMRKL